MPPITTEVPTSAKTGDAFDLCVVTEREEFGCSLTLQVDKKSRAVRRALKLVVTLMSPRF